MNFAILYQRGNLEGLRVNLPGAFDLMPVKMIVSVQQVIMFVSVREDMSVSHSVVAVNVSVPVSV